VNFPEHHPMLINEEFSHSLRTELEIVIATSAAASTSGAYKQTKSYQ